MNRIVPSRRWQESDTVRFDRPLIERMNEAGILSELGRWELMDGFFVDASDPPRPHPFEDADRRRHSIGDERIMPFDRTIVERMREAGILADLGRCEIEMSDDGLEKDLTQKADEYAGAGRGEYWGIDLPNRLVHIHRDPGPEGYGSVVSRAWNETVAPLCAPDAPIIPADQLDRVIPS